MKNNIKMKNFNCATHNEAQNTNNKLKMITFSREEVLLSWYAVSRLTAPAHKASRPDLIDVQVTHYVLTSATLNAHCKSVTHATHTYNIYNNIHYHHYH